MSRPYYATTPFGKLGFQIAQTDSHGAMVSVWETRKDGRSLGLWRLDRFGGKVNAEGVAQWLEEVRK